MDTELTEIEGAGGSIFYDAECAFCRTSKRLLENVLARRGFAWIPLQTLGTAERLGIPEAELLEEMKLLLPGKRVLGGIAAWIHLSRSVWWLWPIGMLFSLPGFNALGRISYRWVARNRHCVGGSCSVQKNLHQRTIPFLDLP